MAVALTVLAASSTLAALASADPVQDAQQTVQNAPGAVQDPGQTINTTSGGAAGDTKYTPVPRGIADAALAGWRQVGGAVFGGPDSQTAKDAAAAMSYTEKPSFDAPDLGQGAKVGSHTVDFFTVAFAPDGPSTGFAGGAACKDPNATDDQLATCVRVPVIYSYTKADGWKEAYRGDKQGFVGAIAWLPDGQTAMAVGGDGCYPRREIYPAPAGSTCAANAAPAASPDKIAGNGLAWRFESGAWNPLRAPTVPPSMTALTSLTFSAQPSDCSAGAECGLAGGLGVVWMWKDGSFHLSYPADGNVVTEFSTAQPDRCLPQANAQFGNVCPNEPFRIRAIRFRPGTVGPTAVGVTAGCCYRNRVQDPTSQGQTVDTGVNDPTVDFPRLMLFGGGAWTTGGLYINDGGALKPSDPRLVTLRDSAYALLDSGNTMSVVLTPGGDQQPTEPSSFVAGPIPLKSVVTFGAVDATNLWWPGDLVGGRTSETEAPQLSSVRLLAGDGDFGSRAPAGNLELQAPPSGPDFTIDWAVGELRRTEQAVAYTTVDNTASTAHAPIPISCPGGTTIGNVTNQTTQCKPDSNPSHLVGSGYLYQLPSYPLNAFSMVGTTGIGWATGDRGAIFQFGGGSETTQLQASTTPPKLGNGQSSSLSDRQAYDSFRPSLSAELGLVPPLASRPLTGSGPAQFVAAGSPDPNPDQPESVAEIAMSRDGSEGWAVGPSGAAASQTRATMYHFNGVRWTRCAASGGASPDPRCASLSGLLSASSNARILTVARVPLENGSDQSRADDFEALALAFDPARGWEFLRYRQGAWEIVPGWTLNSTDTAPTRAQMAFSTPDDGWLLVGSGGAEYLYHLSSGRLVECVTQNYKTDCDDHDAIVPLDPNQSGPQATNQDNAQESTFTSGMNLTSAGGRVYLYGTRQVGTSASAHYPVVLSHSPGQAWHQEFDPKNNVNGDATEQGTLNSLSLMQGSGGKVEGWGIGDFNLQGAVDVGSGIVRVNHTPLLQLAKDGKWQFASQPGPAANEYLLPSPVTSSGGGGDASGRVLQLPDSGGNAPAVAISQMSSSFGGEVWLNPASHRWEGLPAPISGHGISAITPDNRGGFWATVVHPDTAGTWFYDYTPRIHSPVFSDVPHPVREPMTATAAGGDGSFWVATESGTVYRYDRLTGWDQVPVKGWDAGGAVQSPAYAIAVGADGTGLVVGKQGRIADVGPVGVQLDPAALLCSSRPGACGGGRNLRAAAIGPGGSALVGGDDLALLYRPAGGSFATINPPQTARNTKITSISMPAADQAWLATDNGDVFAGTLSGGSWGWVREGLGSSGRALSGGRALRGIAVDRSGHGYAVGDHGLILERSGGGSQPWQRMNSAYGENLSSITLGPGGKGALIGGDAGLVLTLAGGRFEPVQSSDFLDPLGQGTPFSRVVGVALLPGYKTGDVEAWAAVQGTRGAILHYTSDPANPLLAAGAGRAQPLPDAPLHTTGELDFASFGKSDCSSSGSDVCPEFSGSNSDNEVIARGIRDTFMGRRPDVAIFTGDVQNAGGYKSGNAVAGPTDESRIHERWAEQIADPLARAGIPLFGALGGGDLSNTQACNPLGQLVQGVQCGKTQQTRAGPNLAWRQALAGQDAPWGGRDPGSANGLQFQEVGGSTTDPAVNPGKVDTSALPTGSGTVPQGGARTHYAVDISRGGQRLVRLVVADTSLKTLAGTAGLQNPVQDQLRWLDDVLSSRPADERAVVVSETPSYSYDPSVGGATDTLVDSAAFEALMTKDNVSAVVSGRLGWNGLYWLVAPGLHCPRPGDSYQPDPPSDPTRCVASGALDNADQLAASLQGLGAPAPVPSVPQPSQVVKNQTSALSPIPFLVAASAGGQFGPQGGANGNASQGFWHGYSVLRFFPKGGVSIEQRPMFDWIGIQAHDHSVTPGHRLQLKGYGREPVGSDQAIRYDDISGPAVTHVYHLVAANPQRPWEPQVDPALAGPDNPHGYVPVPQNIGAGIDTQTGEVSYRGSGDHPPYYALGILSVGSKAATWPVVLKPRPSFRLTPPIVHNVVVPPVRVESQTPATLPQPPTSQIPNPPQLNLTFPSPPSLPNLSLNAPQTQAPAPPAPPAPPASPAATALQIAPAPVGLNVAPQATVIPPPAPPVQPAPPSGARREARQRQAAVAKSEEGSGQEGAAQEQEGGDAKGGTSAASTRLDTRRDDFAFTAHHGGGSAWPRDLLYGGGLGITALVLALGWGIARPTPRRREPSVPAPAWARLRSRR